MGSVHQYYRRMLRLLTVHSLGCFPRLHPLTQPSQCAHWHRRPDMQIQRPHWCFPEKKRGGDTPGFFFQLLYCAIVCCFWIIARSPLEGRCCRRSSNLGEREGALLKSALTGQVVHFSTFRVSKNITFYNDYIDIDRKVLLVCLVVCMVMQKNNNTHSNT